MKSLNLIFDEEGWTRADEDKDKPIQEITRLVIMNIVQAYAAQKSGLDEVSRRQFYKLLDALDEAVKSKRNTVELEDSEFGFLRKVFSEVKLAPSVLVRKIEDLIQQVPMR